MPRKKEPAKSVSSTRKTPARKTTQDNTTQSTEKSQTITQPSMKEQLKNPRLWVGVAVILILILLYSFKGLFIAATVNGQPISRLAVVGELEKQSGKQALSDLVTQQLILQEAQKRHVSVSQSQLDADVKKIEDSLKGQGVTLDEALSARGLSRNDLMTQLKLQDLLNKMVGQTVNVTDQQVQDYISKNQDNLPKDLTPDQLNAQVKQQLEQQALSQKTQDFITNLQKQANITYFVNY